MAKPSTLTPSQAAAVLAVSATTLRRWSADFGEHLSESARGAGRRHRSYSPDDIATLQRAGELLRTHSPDETKALLAVADETQQSAALATLPTIAGEINMLRSQLAALAGEVAADRAEIERLRSEVASLFDRQRKRQVALETDLADVRAQLADLQARRHWWQRLRNP